MDGLSLLIKVLTRLRGRIQDFSRGGKEIDVCKKIWIWGNWCAKKFLAPRISNVFSGCFGNYIDKSAPLLAPPSEFQGGHGNRPPL